MTTRVSRQLMQMPEMSSVMGRVKVNVVGWYAAFVTTAGDSVQALLATFGAAVSAVPMLVKTPG